MKTDRPSPEQKRPLPQVRLVPPRKPLTRLQHQILGAALVLMVIVLLVLAWSVRQWQEDITLATTLAVTAATEPELADMTDDQVRATLSADALAREGHVIVGIDQAINRINPLYAAGRGEQDAVSLIFESLVQFDSAHKAGLELAESYDFDAAGHQIAFTLRTDHYFRDGRAVEARDVAFTYHLLLANSYDGQLKGYFSAITGVAADPDDSRQVTFQLADWVKEPDMVWFTIGILKSDAYAVNMAKVYDLGLNTPPPEGSGPFELKDQTAGLATLALRPGFAGEITTVDFQQIDSADQYALLKDGQIDIAYNVWDARLKERLDTLPAYAWKTFDATAAYMLVNRTTGGSSVLQTTEQQDAVLALLAGQDPPENNADLLAELATNPLICYFYSGIDNIGQNENRRLAEQAMQKLEENGIHLDFEPADWPDLASRALEGRFDVMVIPTPANERLPSSSIMLNRAETGAALSTANTIVAATQKDAILVSRRLKQVTFNDYSRPLAVSPLSWTDRIENIRVLKQGD